MAGGPPNAIKEAATASTRTKAERIILKPPWARRPRKLPRRPGMVLAPRRRKPKVFGEFKGANAGQR
jgi:hypothetical protein